MSDDLQLLDRELARYAASLESAPRAKLARSLIGTLRKIHAKRILANVTPEGDAMEPRKPRRLEPGKLADRRGKMFAKASASLRSRAGPDGGELGFSGAAGRIMGVHHYGLIDRVSPETKTEIAYPERPVIGLSQDDRERMLDLAATHLLKD